MLVGHKNQGKLQGRLPGDGCQHHGPAMEG